MVLKPDKVLSLLGLAMKAGKVMSGELGTETEVKAGRAALVLIAEDASKNTTKKFRNMCEFYKVPIAVYGQRESLGRAVGKEFRATIAVVDEGFAKSILKQLNPVL